MTSMKTGSRRLIGVLLGGVLTQAAAGQPADPGARAAPGGTQAGVDAAALLELDLSQRGGVPEGYVLVEGDILLPAAAPRGTYNALMWPGGEVPYVFDTSGSDAVSASEQALVVEAMEGSATFAGWERLANVNFRPWSGGDINFVVIRDSSNDVDGSGAPNPTNSSPIGMQGQAQVLNLSFDGNGSTLGVIAHELGHALGFWHEQSRSDRDDFILINFPCIEAGVTSNFDVRTGTGGEYGPYDYASIMHYSSTAFSVAPPGCVTIIGTPPADASLYHGDPNDMGQRNAISPWDERIMSFLYPEPDWVFADGHTSGSGTFLSPLPTFVLAYFIAPDNGTVWLLDPGEYATGGTLSKPVTIRAGYKPVVLTP